MKFSSSPWFSHIGWVVPIVLSIQTIVWAVDRKPPHVFGKYEVSPVKPGGKVVVHMEIKRDLVRNCSATITRQFEDSAGVRFSIGGAQTYNIQTVLESEKRTPGVLAIGFDMPFGAAKGMGAMISTTDYTCNPIHLMWPIQRVMVHNIEVLG